MTDTPTARPSPAPDRLRILRRALAEPARYVRAWYVAYLLLGIVTAGMIPVLLPLMMVSLSGVLSTVAYVMGAYNLGLLSSPLWGLWADRRKVHRSLFFLAFLLLGACTALMPLLRGVGPWMPVAFGMGLGSAGVATMGSLFIVDFTPSSEWEPCIGYLQSFNGAGQVLGLLLAGLFTAGLFSAGLWLAAALVIPAVAVGRVALPGRAGVRAPGPKRTRIYELLQIRALAVFPRLHFMSGVGYHFHALTLRGLRQLPKAVRTPFGRFILSWFMLALGVSAFFAYFPVMLAKEYGIEASLSSLIYALAAGVGIVLFVLASKWAERYGSGRVYQVGLWIRLLGFVLLLVPLIVTVRHSFAVAAIGLVLIVMSWSLLSVAGIGLAARLAPFSEGAAMGLFNGSLACATVLGTFASGPLLHGFGFAVVPVMGLAGLALAIALGMRLPTTTPTADAAEE